MSRISRVVTIFNNLAGFEIPAEKIRLYVDAVVSDRDLEGGEIRTDEQKAAIFLNWMKEIIRDHKIAVAAKPSLIAAEEARDAARTEVVTDLGDFETV